MSSFLKVIDIGIRSALFTKFGSFLDLVDVNTGVLLYPKEVAFRMLSEKKGETISEFINVWRTKVAPSWERQRTPVARHGIRLAYTDDTGQTTTNATAMPVDLAYNVWFWSKDLDKLNLIAEEYLFWQQSNPNLNLYYNDIYPAELDLHFGELIDESDVPSMLNKGNHFCMRVPISVDGWIFASTSTNAVIQKIELVVYDSQNLTNYKECIYESSDYDPEVEAALNIGEQHFYGILEVDQDNKTFSVNRDNLTEFIADNVLYVNESTGNDGMYTIVSAVDATDYTTITVVESIPDSTVDGVITLKNIE